MVKDTEIDPHADTAPAKAEAESNEVIAKPSNEAPVNEIAEKKSAPNATPENGNRAADKAELPAKKKQSLAWRIGKTALRVVVGVALGCVIAEVAFGIRDHHAFPHLNVYQPDAELGVRLRPGATEHIVFGPNPETDVRINAQGYRGADWPTPGDDEILVVGDSQVFGLGVEENETTSAALAKLLPGKIVLNGGVPTYGPAEYTKVVAEVFEKRHPKAVVFVVNFANDLYEASHPNKDRHAVWDGWAVHKETAPDHIAQFPGRDFLYRQSHAFYAFRQFWYAHGPSFDDRSFTPKRTWRDISLAGVEAEDDHEKAIVDTARLASKHQNEIADASKQSLDAEAKIHELIARNIPGSLDGQNATTYNAGGASPGDIVGYVDTGEYDEPVTATAEMIREGAVYRAKMEELLKQKAKADATVAAEIDKSFQDRQTTEASLKAKLNEPAPIARAWSPVAPALREVKALCDAHKARLFVVALPLDVQISAEEWKKYGAEPRDMSPANLLVSDVVDAATEIGATPINPSEALKAAEPGAFLMGDIHMTPKGHAALAALIAKVMSEPPPIAKPKSGLPPNRTKVPEWRAWENIREVTVHGSDAAQCQTNMVREWLRVLCKMKTPDAPKPVGIKVVSGGHGEAFITTGDDQMALLVPVLPDDHFEADFSWSDRTQRLTVQWAKGAQFPEMVIAPPTKKAPSEVQTPLAMEPFCGCMRTHVSDFPCVGHLLDPSADCARTYGTDCDKLMSCLNNEADASPSCPEGQANAGTTGRCYALCSDEKPCAQGSTCTEWQGGHVCF